jgi:outer membrane protein TolC
VASYTNSVLPQRRAASSAALAAYRANGGSITQVLTAEAATLGDSMTLVRALSEFARSVAALELLVGAEVLP